MARWYIIHAYSGFENKVRDAIMAEAERLGLAALVEAGASQPLFMKEAGEIMQSLSTWSPKELSEKMDISPQLAEETAQRHLNWSAPFHPGNAKLAVLAFHGEVSRVARVVNAHQFDEAHRMLEAGTPFAKASSALSVAFLQLRKDAGV